MRVRRLAPVAVALAGAAILITLRHEGRSIPGPDALRYDIERFEGVDSRLLTWDEVLSLPLGPGEHRGLAADRKGTIHVTSEKRVVTYDEHGSRLGERRISGPGGAVAVGEKGEIYLAAGDAVEVLSPGGELVRWPSLGEKALLTSISAGGGEVFVADAGQRIVWRFDGDGRLLGRIGGGRLLEGRTGFLVPSPYFDLVLEEGNTLWVVNPGRLRVERYDGEGRLQGFWGEASLAVTGFGGCCNPSHIALLPDGSVVTSEKGLPRVKIHRPDGRLSSVVAGPGDFRPGTVGLDLAVDSRGRVLVLDPARRLLRVFSRRTVGHGGPDEGA